MADLARARRSTFPSRDDALARYASRPPLNTMRADVLRAYVDDGFVDLPDGSVRLACLPEDEARTFESETKVHTSNVTDVAAPVTVVVGHDEEGPNPARLGPGLVAALPHAELIRRPELGHLGPFQDPVLVAADIRAHLGKIVATLDTDSPQIGEWHGSSQMVGGVSAGGGRTATGRWARRRAGSRGTAR